MMSPPSSKAAHKLRLTPPKALPECERCAKCTCKSHNRVLGSATTAGQADLSSEEPMQLEPPDSGLGLESEDPGFYDMESCSDEDWDEDTEVNTSLEPHMCQRSSNHPPQQHGQVSSHPLYQCKDTSNADSGTQAQSITENNKICESTKASNNASSKDFDKCLQNSSQTKCEAPELESVDPPKELESVSQEASEQNKKYSEALCEEPQDQPASVGAVEAGKRMLSSGSKVLFLYLLFLAMLLFSFCSLAIPIGVKAIPVTYLMPFFY